MFDDLHEWPLMDWERFNKFTDGDAVEEAELIALFISCNDETIGDIKNACVLDNAAEWQLYTHRLKGSSANMGALRLAEICRRAEMGKDEPFTIKQKLCRAIEDGYGQTCQHLEQTHRQKRAG